MPTRVKICGITRPEDATLAVEFGADFIGLNFIAGPRKVTPARAFQILQPLSESCTRVGLLNSESPRVDAVDPLDDVHSLPLNIFQLYNYNLSDPSFKTGPQEKFSYWFVRHVGSPEMLAQISRDWDGRLKHRRTRSLHLTAIEPAALLLDTASPSGQLGGTGHSFNWHWIAEAREAGELNGLPPIILAGGLTPDNVADAIRIARPYAVDVSSGVEVPGKPGIKDPIKLRDFIQAAKGAL